MNYDAMNFEVLKEKRSHPILESVFALSAGLFFIGSIIGILAFFGERKGEDLVIFGVCIVLALVFLKLTDLVWTKSTVVPTFISTNNFQPEQMTGMHLIEQSIALSGRLANKKLGIQGLRPAHAFTGSIGKWPFHAFELMKSDEDLFKKGQAQDLGPYMLVMTIDIGREVPHIYIANRRGTEGVGKTSLGGIEEGWIFNQPGNFKAINKDPKKYVIYAPDKLEPEVLTLLNPSVLEVLAAAGGGCDVELWNRRLVVYQFIGWIEDRYRSYQTAFKLTQELLQTMERSLQTMRYDASGDLARKTKDIYSDQL